MSSALTSRGSTRQWRTIRAAYAQQLAYLGRVDCWRDANNRNRIADGLRTGQVRPPVDQSPDCTRTIQHGQAWVLGHKTDRADGGTDHDLGYECAPCSSYTGARAGNRRRAQRRPGRRRAW